MFRILGFCLNCKEFEDGFDIDFGSGGEKVLFVVFFFFGGMKCMFF